MSQLLFGLVGDGLLEPFWPTGTGIARQGEYFAENSQEKLAENSCLVSFHLFPACSKCLVFCPYELCKIFTVSRGFLGGLDAVWMVRQWASGDMTPIEVMEEREAILKLLPQTTPENLTKDFKSISMEPRTRYPSIPIQLIRSQADREYFERKCGRTRPRQP